MRNRDVPDKRSHVLTNNWPDTFPLVSVRIFNFFSGTTLRWTWCVDINPASKAITSRRQARPLPQPTPPQGTACPWRGSNASLAGPARRAFVFRAREPGAPRAPGWPIFPGGLLPRGACSRGCPSPSPPGGRFTSDRAGRLERALCVCAFLVKCPQGMLSQFTRVRARSQGM